ncbi:six-cysteine containing astacin protease 4 precursor, partial [Silurus asotus]
AAELSVGELLERANRGIVRDATEPKVIEDIAVDDENSERNADPCTSSYCMWPKSSDGKVYVPYVISNQFNSRELQIIQRGLDSFSSVTCIRFVRRSNQRDYLSIASNSGCYSFVGRRGNAQSLSLDKNGCIYHNTVQHELLHALGFNHEQCRSDRDSHIRVVWENIIDSYKYAFDKIATLNQGTPYDYNSVMQYHRTAFSKNGQPTMVPIPNSNVAFGQGTQMSQNDITRVNKLYKCCPTARLTSRSRHRSYGARFCCNATLTANQKHSSPPSKKFHLGTKKRSSCPEAELQLFLLHTPDQVL